MKHTTISKPTHGSPEWLAVRWKNEDGLARISASVAAAIYDSHPYVTSADLATQLLASEAPQPIEQNAAMLRGTTLEGPVREWAQTLLNVELTEPDVMYVYEEDGVRLIATLDAISTMGAVYEIKTSKKRFDGVLPVMWYWQGVHQAICADVSEITWCVLDGDLDLKFHTQKVSSDEKRQHIEACRNYLACIDMGMYPETAIPSYENISTLHPNANGGSVELSADAVQLLEQLTKTKAMVSELEEHASALQAAICQEIGDNSQATVDGNVVATWKEVSRNSFDQKKFEKEHSALHDKYKKTTTYRQFRINKGDK
jgi:hypothetical protein